MVAILTKAGACNSGKQNTTVNQVFPAKWHLDFKNLWVKLFGLCSGEAAGEEDRC